MNELKICGLVELVAMLKQESMLQKATKALL